MTVRGRGPLPKPADKRVRVNKDPIPTTVLEFVAGSQPRLPPKTPEGKPWPARTKSWWAMWGASPLSGQFGASDWSELLDTAAIHARFWRGDVRVAAELRQRVAKFGATPEDRARLRITFAQADDADAKRAPGDSRSKYGDLRAVDSADTG